MQFKRLLFICSFVGLVTSTMLPPARSDDPVLPPQNRRKVVLINPVVACNDDGTNPAAFQLPKHAIDQAYAEFGIEFLFLDPVRWNNTQALSVTAEFDQVIRRGLQQRILCRDKHVLNLLFVTSIDNESGPPTSTGDAGTICTIALDQGGDHSSAHSNTQLLVDRVGSCLHLVDPAKTQNSAVNDRIEFLSVQDGRELLVDESWEPYGSKATDNFVRFSIGLDGDAPIPQDKAAREEMIRQRFAEKVLEFSDAEKEKIRDAIARLEELTGHDWPLVSRMPWRFVKVDSSFCSGFPHTRGMTIVMPERGLQRMQVNETAAIALLLHEKLHVIQRLYSSRFDPLFNEYGFERIKLADGELER
ncbi:MAG: hypothetical protein KDB00_06660, partial [Planctomycetales bacterium]|nr:hypothetical protein [Planctomycetales bacterium]